MEPDEFAAAEAEKWKKGLAEWGQDGARIARLRDAADIVIYTPGQQGRASRSRCCARSTRRPPRCVDDADLMRERVDDDGDEPARAASGSTPIRSSRASTSCSSTLLDAAWRDGQGLDIAALIQQIQQPPVARVGVLELEAFFPQKERFELAMALNNLLAAPGFGAWMEGEPLDVQRLLYTPQGKPRARDLLDRAPERRRAHVLRVAAAQPGARLDAHAVGHDEPAGAPLHGRDLRLPAADREPAVEDRRCSRCSSRRAPSAWAWCSPRRTRSTSTTRRCRMPAPGSSAGCRPSATRCACSTGSRALVGRRRQLRPTGDGTRARGLGNRVFLMHNVHEDGPEIFESRWAMSYLRGPLTRTQIKTLMDPRRGEFTGGAGRAAGGGGPPAGPAGARRPRSRARRRCRRAGSCRRRSRSSSRPPPAARPSRRWWSERRRCGSPIRRRRSTCRATSWW